MKVIGTVDVALSVVGTIRSRILHVVLDEVFTNEQCNLDDTVAREELSISQVIEYVADRGWHWCEHCVRGSKSVEERIKALIGDNI